MKHSRYIITNIDITTIHDIYTALLLNHLLARRLGSAVARGGFQLSNPISPCVPHTLSTKTQKTGPRGFDVTIPTGARANVLYPSVAAQTTWTLYGKWMHPLLCVLYFPSPYYEYYNNPFICIPLLLYYTIATLHMNTTI